MRKSATKHSLKTLRADINPVGSKLTRHFYRAKHGSKSIFDWAMRWRNALVGGWLVAHKVRPS